MLRLRHRFGEDIEGPEEVTKRLRQLVLLPGFMCDEDLWTDMVPDLGALGTIHYGNVYEDDTLDGMARRVLASSPERFVLVGFSMGGFVARVLTLFTCWPPGPLAGPKRTSIQFDKSSTWSCRLLTIRVHHLRCPRRRSA